MQQARNEAPKGGKLRGHPCDSPEVQLSKTLSWLLRHGAKSQGLPMREDGYVRVKDLLETPKLRSLDFSKLEQIVKDDVKGRYDLKFEPKPELGGAARDGWWIRANQGHSIKDVKLEYTPLTRADQVPMAVHGTTRKAWAFIKAQGLSRMKRTHIHIAQGVPGSGVISGMRNTSAILIYIDLEKALDIGLKFWISQNGVVLTEGDEHGFLKPEFFAKVEATDGKDVPGHNGELWPRRSTTTDRDEVLANRRDRYRCSGTWWSGPDDPPSGANGGRDAGSRGGYNAIC